MCLDMAVTTTSNIFAIPSLFHASTMVVIYNLDSFENSLWETPANIKQAVLRLMSTRGLITDDNIDKVLHPHVQCLDLSISKVSDQCLRKLSRLRHLIKIDLNSFKEPNESITSAGIISLSKFSPHLQIVYLRRNVNVTDEGIIAISKGCPILRELNVGGCVLLTDATLVALGNNSKHLKSLNISATQVTDNGIDSLCHGLCCQVLTEVDVSGCKKLTDDAVEMLISMCPLMKILLFAACPNISENARVALEDKLLSTEGARMKQVSWTIY